MASSGAEDVKRGPETDVEEDRKSRCRTPTRETAPLLSLSRTKSRIGDEVALDIRNLVIVNLVAALYFMAANMHNPTMDQYLYKRMTHDVFGNTTDASQSPDNFTCYINKSDKHYLLQEEAQERASRKQMYFAILRGVFAVISVFIIGSYSDFIGRKTIFVVSMTGSFARYCILTAIIYWELDFNYYFIGEAISGMTGYDYSFLLASYAYTADNTPPKKSRTIAIGVLETTLNLANAATQTATGYFIQSTGFLFPSLTSAVLMFLTAVFVLVLVTETLPWTEIRQKECVGPCVGLKRIAGIYCFDDTKKIRSLIILILFAYLFYIMPSSSISNTATLYMLNQPFCWSPEKIGSYTMAGTAAKQVLGVPLIKLLHYCTNDQIIGILSSTALVGAYVLHGLAYTSWMMYGVALLEALTFAISPTIRAIMSRMTPRDRQGSLFTSQMMVQAVSTLVGTPAFNSLYQATVNVWRGSVYLSMAGLQLISVIILSIFTCRSPGADHSIRYEEEVTIQESDSHTYSSADMSASVERSYSIYGSDPSSQAFRNSGRYVRSFEASSSLESHP